jgi:uncharacterized protein (TIGR02118 family)
VIKIVFAARRRQGISLQEFADYWTDVHANLARRIPGVQRYVINVTQPRGSEEGPAFDGVAEIAYATKDDLKAAAASPEAAAVLADEANLFDLASCVRLLVREHVIVG